MTEPATLDPPAASTPAAPPPAGPLADLILVRLLPAARSRPSEKKIRDDVSGFFRRRPSAEEFADTVAGLRAAGLLAPKGQHLTDAGRTRALAYLGVSELPAKVNWGTIKAKHLVPKALGVSPDSVADAKKLAPLQLKRKLGLPDNTPATIGGVLNAIACREAGFPDLTLRDFRTLKRYLLGKAIGSDEPIGGNDVANVVPRVLLGAKRGGAEGLREAVLTGWIGDEPRVPVPETRKAPPESEVPFDLEAFANTVKAAARTCPTGRFGDNKVFISHVWRQLADHPQIGPLGPDGFKAKLVEANRENLLTLSRADLYQVQDPADLDESETRYHDAVFHFILANKE